jgi:predicted ATP-grasp superfamily ATP-dependent carboligase
LVNEGVKLGFADLVDPKSMTIDVQALVGAFAQDTNAIGVVKVEVREATRDGSLKLQGKKIRMILTDITANTIIYRYGRLLRYIVFE